MDHDDNYHQFSSKKMMHKNKSNSSNATATSLTRFHLRLGSAVLSMNFQEALMERKSLRYHT